MKRFWDKVDVRSDDECWVWQAGFRADGYGAFSFYGQTTASHRVAYELAHGMIPEDGPGYHGWCVCATRATTEHA